ncbi:hypothetical protein ACFFVB_12705 [Formosa undariae]|uniref:Apea-like HEPN domain-containing protein n=1 Tax=Formosa undariae TaxID=1325436 RepID=A0ABV5F3E0_9FLAO
MANHDNIPVWEVDISVIGPISIRNRIRINTRKELKHSEPFYSDISITNNENGFQATVTAFAPTSELAEKAAILFFGRMLDVLSINLNLSLQLDVSNNVIIQKTNENVKRIVDQNDFIIAFQDSRFLSLTETTFLRGLSWFRKGKYSQDPYDKFLAFWNSIETVTSKYNPNKISCKSKGSKCHMWECFKKIWGECENWEFIGGQNKWIDEGYSIRKDIAHGIIPIEIDHIEKIVTKLPEIENVSHKFLIDWMKNELKTDVSVDVFKKLK